MVAMMLNLGVGITPDKVARLNLACPPALIGLADSLQPTDCLTDGLPAGFKRSLA